MTHQLTGITPAVLKDVVFAVKTGVPGSAPTMLPIGTDLDTPAEVLTDTFKGPCILADPSVFATSMTILFSVQLTTVVVVKAGTKVGVTSALFVPKPLPCTKMRLPAKCWAIW